VVKKKVEEIEIEAKSAKGEDADMTQEDPSKDIEIQSGIRIERRPIRFFKFWPKDILGSAWRNYITTGESGANLNAAYLTVQVLDKVTEQFVLSCITKMNKKAAKVGQKQEFLEQYNAGAKHIVHQN